MVDFDFRDCREWVYNQAAVLHPRTSSPSPRFKPEANTGARIIHGINRSCVGRKHESIEFYEN